MENYSNRQQWPNNFLNFWPSINFFSNKNHSLMENKFSQVWKVYSYYSVCLAECSTKETTETKWLKHWQSDKSSLPVWWLPKACSMLCGWKGWDLKSGSVPHLWQSCSHPPSAFKKSETNISNQWLCNLELQSFVSSFFMSI